MTDKQLLEQALEALENTTPTGFNMERDKQFFASIAALRTAIKAAEKQEPVAFQVIRGELCYKSQDDDQSYGMWCPVTPHTDLPFVDGTEFYTTPPAQPAPVQEPFCFVYVENGEEYFAPKGAYVADNAQPLYTTPPAQEFTCSTGLCHYKPAAQPAVPLTDEQKRDLIKKSALWDMHIHIGWYSAPAKSFVEKTIQLIADIEAAHGIGKGQP